MASGKQIKQARELAGIAQYELAGKLGIAQSVLSDWERGAREPSEKQAAKAFAIIRRLRDQRDVKLAEVMGGDTDGN